MAQQPLSGAQANSNSTVNYCVSSGPKQETLPSQATVNAGAGTTIVTSLQNAGFTNVTTKNAVSTSGVPTGNGIDIQDANGNSELGKTLPVTTPLVVVISTGAGNVTIPTSVLSEACSTAYSQLISLGLAASSTFTYEANAGFQNNTVITTSPVPGSSVPKNTPVTITCASNTSASASTSPTATASATATDTSGFTGIIGQGNGNGGGN
jgi:beta-lactam-binding protein with PASTA domain